RASAQNQSVAKARHDALFLLAEYLPGVGIAERRAADGGRSDIGKQHAALRVKVNGPGAWAVATDLGQAGPQPNTLRVFQRLSFQRRQFLEVESHRIALHLQDVSRQQVVVYSAKISIEDHRLVAIAPLKIEAPFLVGQPNGMFQDILERLLEQVDVQSNFPL